MIFHHLGYLVHDIDKSINAFINLGYQVVGQIVYDPLREIKVCFIKLDKNLIELVQAFGENSIVKSMSKNVKYTQPYHIGYEVDSLDEVIKQKREGDLIIQKPLEAIAFGNRRVLFMYNINIGIIEFIEKDI